MKTNEKYYYELSYRYFTAPLQMTGLTEGEKKFENDNLLEARDAAFAGLRELITGIFESNSLSYTNDEEAQKLAWKLIFPSEVIRLKIPKIQSYNQVAKANSFNFDIGVSTDISDTICDQNSRVYLDERENYYTVNIIPYDINQYIRIKLIYEFDLSEKKTDLPTGQHCYYIHGIEFTDLKQKYLNALKKEVDIFKLVDGECSYKTRLIKYYNERLDRTQMLLPTPLRYYKSIDELLASL